jgi:outer membrane immunogenic protein
LYKAPPPVASPAYDWSGFYAGLNAGYSWGRTPYDYSVAGAPAASNTLKPESFIGGAQAGYNFQTGPFVFGVEADFAWRDGTGTTNVATPNGLTTFRDEQGWVGTLRPRAGVATNNWLFYGTGGLAYGWLKQGYTEAQPGASRTATDSEIHTGWTAGGGVEFAANNRWSLGLEYLYQDLGKSTLSQPGQTVGGVVFAPSSTTFEDRSHVLRAKLNVKFGWDGPAISR